MRIVWDIDNESQEQIELAFGGSFASASLISSSFTLKRRFTDIKLTQRV
jgi:hypothetical protein